MRWLVIVYPARPKQGDTAMYSSSPNGYGATVLKVTARTAEAAADLAKIQPGAHALIVEESKARRFDRAEQAPLTERRPDGNPLDLVEAA
jgi:hypothetical protein